MQSYKLSGQHTDVVVVFWARCFLSVRGWRSIILCHCYASSQRRGGSCPDRKALASKTYKTKSSKYNNDINLLIYCKRIISGCTYCSRHGFFYIRGWMQMVLAPNDLFSWNNKYNKYNEYCVVPWEGRMCGPCEWGRHLGKGRGQAPGPE